MIHVIGNWKMNKNNSEAIDFCNQLQVFLHQSHLSCFIGIAPPLLCLPGLYKQFKSINLIAQNVASQESGAYTGEISASMLSDYVDSVIIGHSERRLYFNETSSVLYQKLLMCFEHDFKPIFCIGESVYQRNSGDYLTVLKNQLESSVMLLPIDNIANLMIAYEPVWAIGTGQTASPNQIKEVHDYIRLLLAHKIGLSKSDSVPILYGGSCNSINSESILTQKNVNGLLVGGASLDCEHFIDIIKIANSLS